MLPVNREVMDSENSLIVLASFLERVPILENTSMYNVLAILAMKYLSIPQMHQVKNLLTFVKLLYERGGKLIK
jgi:hypothetical protein